MEMEMEMGDRDRDRDIASDRGSRFKFRGPVFFAHICARANTVS